MAPPAGMVSLAPAALVALLAAAGPVEAGDQPGCLLRRPGGELAAADACLHCHVGGHAADSHPVDLDYARARSHAAGLLRPEAEVVARGGFLPDGKVRCATCHDARSPWAHHVVLPPGAVARPAVDQADPRTYAGADPLRPAGPLPPGTEVATRPLCLLCHALD